MTDQATAPEPGWKPSSLPPEEELFQTPESQPRRVTTTSEGAPATSASTPAADLARNLNRSGSSPESSDALAGLISEALQLLSALASLFTVRNLGVDIKMRPGEARATAKPIASLIARRFQIRRELAEATDATATGANLMAYIERVATAKYAAPPPVDRFVAAAPAPTAVPLAEEPRPAPPPAPAPFAVERAPIHEPNGAAVPGSGETRAAFLSGFD